VTELQEEISANVREWWFYQSQFYPRYFYFGHLLPKCILNAKNIQWHGLKLEDCAEKWGGDEKD